LPHFEQVYVGLIKRNNNPIGKNKMIAPQTQHPLPPVACPSHFVHEIQPIVFPISPPTKILYINQCSSQGLAPSPLLKSIEIDLLIHLSPVTTVTQNEKKTPNVIPEIGNTYYIDCCFRSSAPH